MTLAGWILLSVSWGTLASLVYYCMRRTLQEEARDAEGSDPEPPAD